MKNIWSRFHALLTSTALVAVLMLAMVSSVWAGDKVVLKDGRVLEGTIVREVNGSIWMTYTIGGIEQKGFFTADQIDHIERDTNTPPAGEKPVTAKSEQGDSATSPKAPGVQRAVVITLEEEVGLQFAAKPLEDALPWLEANDVDIVVFKINSGGGMLLEVPRMHKIMATYKEKFRTVAWIESAISAAAMSSYPLEEIYFMPDGNFGACTAWSGQLKAVEGRGLEEVLYMMEKISAVSHRDPAIMRSMQIEVPLSYNKNKDGTIEWFNTEEGEHLVNPKGRILTFDAQQALECKFSRGVASNLDELEKLLGVPEIEWLGKHVPGELFPISKAEADMRKWRKSVTEAQEKFNSYYAKYQISVANAQSAQDINQRGMFVGRARRHLHHIRKACKDHPNIQLLNGIPDEWFDQQERMLRDLMKP